MKAAILIDGGYFFKRLPAVRKDIDSRDPKQVDRAIGQCFYYDEAPYTKKGHLPVSCRAIDYAKSDEAQFRLALFDLLRKRPGFAVRLGEVRRDRSWILREGAQADLLAKRRQVDDLTDADFEPGFRQKAVDMRIGVDITSISLKKQSDTTVLVAGDSDFVLAAKLARREGIRIVLDPLWRSVDAGLFEHIDALRSGFGKPKAAAAVAELVGECV
jgi:uncharacterized LabA/DUF88 family protein